MLDLRFINNKFNEIIEGKIEGIQAIDRADLYDNGDVFYMNGNDGTDFDYNVNDRTCEFYVFLKEGDGYIKAYHTLNKVVFYVYDRNDPYNGKAKRIEIKSKYGLTKVCDALSENFDQKGKYDKKVENWVF